MTLARLAVAAALPLALSSVSGAAAEDVTVDGCYGVAVIVCDPTVHVSSPVKLQRYTMTVPVCAGTCTYVPVPMYRTVDGGSPYLCVTWESDDLDSLSCNAPDEE